MIEALQEAGWPAYVVLAFAVLALALAIAALVAAFSGAARGAGIGLSAGAILTSVVTVGVGGLGYMIMMRDAFEAVAFADASARATLLAQGISEAMNNIVIGSVCAAPSFLLGGAALIATLMRRSAATRARGD